MASGTIIIGAIALLAIVMFVMCVIAYVSTPSEQRHQQADERAYLRSLRDHRGRHA